MALILASALSHGELAAMFGTSATLIQQVRYRHIWTHVPGEVNLAYRSNFIPRDSRFLMMVDRDSAPNGCWLWTGTRNRDGYGEFSVGNRKNQGAHRVSYRIAYGEIPAGRQVLHRCDTPPCCRPDHLFLGTHFENMVDMTTKGRRKSVTGEAHPGAKLTEADVITIRASSETRAALARQYGVSRCAIGEVVLRKKWKSVA